MQPRLVFALVITLLIITGCGLFSGHETRLTANFTPPALGFEIEDDGTIVIVSNSVEFRNAFNGPEAVITGYLVEVFNQSGTELLGVGSEIESGHVSILVPRGYVCIDGADECAPGLRRGTSTAVSEGQPFVFVAGPVATTILANDLIGARADVTFYATWGTRVDYSFKQSVTITYPVGE